MSRAFVRGFWLALLGPLLTLPPLRRRLWDRRGAVSAAAGGGRS